MLAILPRKSVRILTILGIVGVFAAVLRSAVYNTSTFSRGEWKTSSLGHGHALPRITVTRMRTAWAETTRTIMAEPGPTTHPRQQNPLTDEPLQKHNYRSDGLLEVNPDGPHPIFELIRNAEVEWEAKLARSSKTLAQAVVEYQRRYKRLPPLGFDEWFVRTFLLTVFDQQPSIISGGSTSKITMSSSRTNMTRSTRTWSRSGAWTH